MGTGIKCNITPSSEEGCKAYKLGKMRRNQFPKRSPHRATKPYEVIHSDVCSPTQIESTGWSKYMVTFTDDYTSSYATIYFIKKKSSYKEYANFVEN